MTELSLNEKWVLAEVRKRDPGRSEGQGVGTRAAAGVDGSVKLWV